METCLESTRTVRSVDGMIHFAPSVSKPNPSRTRFSSMAASSRSASACCSLHWPERRAISSSRVRRRLPGAPRPHTGQRACTRRRPCCPEGRRPSATARPHSRWWHRCLRLELWASVQQSSLLHSHSKGYASGQFQSIPNGNGHRETGSFLSDS